MHHYILFMMRKQLLTLVFTCWVMTSFAQEIRLLKGRINDSINIDAEGKETYAVYLPKEFDLNTKWPVIYVFDPAARAAVSMAPFIEGAEKYGFVVVGSNSIKNGGYQENLDKVGRLFEAVAFSIPVDEKLTFVSGFSGGSRLATSIAVIAKEIKGVIACGAAYALTPPYAPIENTFLYVGVVGDEDFNYAEMRNGLTYLKSRKFDADLLVFEGGHQWPPSEYLTKAIRTLKLKTMTRGLLPKNEQEIKEFYKSDLEFGEKLKSSNKLLWAYDDLENMIKNYRFYVETDSLKDISKILKKDPIYRAQQKEEARVADAEALYVEDYMTFLPEDAAKGDLEALGFWEAEILKLNDIEKSPKVADQKMVKRIKGLLGVYTYELGASYTEKEQLSNLLFLSIFQTLLYPERSQPYLNTIRYSAMQSYYDMALYYLEELLKTGYKDVEALQKLEDIALLRIMPEYSDLLKKYELETRY